VPDGQPTIFEFDGDRRREKRKEPVWNGLREQEARLHDFDGKEPAVLPPEVVGMTVGPVQVRPDPRYRRIEIPLTPPALRPYQEKGFEAWLENRRGILLMATATGKTILALHAIRKLGVHSLVVVPTIQLAWQWIGEFKKYGVTAGIWYGDRKDVRPVMVMVYNSAVIVLDDPNVKALLDRFGLVVFDEIHHLGGGEFGKLRTLVNDGRAVLGLTASLREGSVEHGRILDAIPIVYRFGVADALAVKAVAPIIIEPVLATMAGGERQRYDDLSEKIRKGMRNLRVHDITAVARMATHAGNDGWTARAVLSAITNRKMLMSHIVDKIPKALSVIQRHPGERVLLFSESIDAIESMETYLREVHVRAAVYHSEQPVAMRRMTLADWGRSFDVLLSVRALDEGIDVPEVAVGLIVASGRSERQLIQRIGRIIRPMPGKTARIYVVYCQATIEDKVFAGVREIVTRMSDGKRFKGGSDDAGAA